MTEHLTVINISNLNNNLSHNKYLLNKDIYISEDENIIIYIPYKISRKNKNIKERIRISID
jgi:hypothetical protein